MVSIVKRTAKKLGLRPLELLPVWEDAVKRATAMNAGKQDSRAFIIAATRFMEATGVEAPPKETLNLKRKIKNANPATS